MAGINKAIILGNVGRIETKTTQAGDTIVNLSLATSYKGKDGQDVTEWHNCVFFKKVAEICAKYVQKGMKLYVEGQLKTEKWQDQSGVDRYTTKIIVRDMQICTSKAEGVASSGGDYAKAREGSAPVTMPQSEIPDDYDNMPF